MSALHSVSVAGVTFDNAGRVLLIRRRDNGEWQAPGGVLELSETFEVGVKREVLEETGVYVEVEQLTGVYKNVTLGVVALVYRCSRAGGEPRSSIESAEVEWLPIDQARKNMTAAFFVRIEDALPSKLRPASRVHDGRRLL